MAFYEYNQSYCGYRIFFLYERVIFKPIYTIEAKSTQTNCVLLFSNYSIFTIKIASLDFEQFQRPLYTLRKFQRKNNCHTYITRRIAANRSFSKITKTKNQRVFSVPLKKNITLQSKHFYRTKVNRFSNCNWCHEAYPVVVQ